MLRLPVARGRLGVFYSDGGQHALVAQLAEATDSKPVQCRFESDRGHSDVPARLPSNVTTRPPTARGYAWMRDCPIVRSSPSRQRSSGCPPRRSATCRRIVFRFSGCENGECAWLGWWCGWVIGRCCRRGCGRGRSGWGWRSGRGSCCCPPTGCRTWIVKSHVEVQRGEQGVERGGGTTELVAGATGTRHRATAALTNPGCWRSARCRRRGAWRRPGAAAAGR